MSQDVSVSKDQLHLSVKPTVFICSPYRGDINTNLENAKKYSRFASQQGYAVFCPHLLYTQFLNDSIERERIIGIQSGIEFLQLCDEIWVFAPDYESCSVGMKSEIDESRKNPTIKCKFIDPKTLEL